jgi:hypothetical protein
LLDDRTPVGEALQTPVFEQPPGVRNVPSAVHVGPTTARVIGWMSARRGATWI